MTTYLPASELDGDDLDDADDADIEGLLPDTGAYSPSPEPTVTNEYEDSQPTTGDLGARGAGKPAPKTAGPDRAVIRKAALKAQELFLAPDAELKLLAHLLGSTTDTVDLTVAVLTAPRTATRAATDLFEIAETEPMEAVMAVMALPKDRGKALWNLLVALDEVKGVAPANDAKAALSTAKAAIKVTPAAANLLRAAVALAKRS